MSAETQKKWVHVIGICGTTTSGIALMFKNLGWKVTGSDKGFYPPVSDFLNIHKIPFEPGFKLERLYEDGKNPDLIVFQGTKSEKNEEYLEALKLGIPVRSYAEILAEYVIAPESIVVAGSFGKTTTTALLVKIFENAGIPVSYMFAGFTPDFIPTIAAKNEATRFSIVEGDEYLTSQSDKRSKFFHYSPKYLLLTGIEYDHADLFPTFKDYLDNFRELLTSIPKNGIVFANIDDQNTQKVLPAVTCTLITYSLKQNLKFKPDWYLLSSSKPLPTLIKSPRENSRDLEIIPFERSILGQYNDANILAAACLSYELGVKKGAIIKAVKDFNGIQRRLEIKYRFGEKIVIDDFGSTPAKSGAALRSLKSEFPGHRLVAVFEPNAGNRTQIALALFDTALSSADHIILPKFTALPNSKQLRYTEEDLLERLSEHDVSVSYCSLDTDLVQDLTQEFKSHKKIIIVFLGSHSFRGMIPKLIEQITHGKKA